eukprot:gene10490-12255_t
MCNIPDANEVSLIPASAHDWDVISTQASYVENNMLKEHVLLYSSQIVIVNISPSLFVRLVVQVVTTRPVQGSGDFAVGRITNATTLIIAPYESKPTFAAKDSAQNGKEEESIEWEKVKFEPHSHLQLLYVLPQKARYQDSSFQCIIPKNSETISITSEEPNFSVPDVMGEINRQAMPEELTKVSGVSKKTKGTSPPPEPKPKSASQSAPLPKMRMAKTW